MATTAFTWKAALNISIIQLPAVSTCNLFQINPKRGPLKGHTAHAALRDKLHGLRILIVDEVGMINLRHFHHMNCQTQKARSNDLFFGNVLAVMAGEFNQHAPPSGSSLYKDSAKFAGHEYNEVQEGSNDWKLIMPSFLKQ